MYFPVGVFTEVDGRSLIDEFLNMSSVDVMFY